jgi:hypothetical protein
VTDASIIRVSKTPREVSDYIRAAVEYVKRAVGMELDGSDDSLAVLDHYVAQVPADKTELGALVAPAVGAYFGEVLRRRFGGCWRLDGEPTAWRLDLGEGGAEASVAPIAVALTALRRDEVEGIDAELQVPVEDRPGLVAALERTAPVTAEYYYSLTGRFETLAHTLDLLAALRAGRREEGPAADEESEDRELR